MKSTQTVHFISVIFRIIDVKAKANLNGRTEKFMTASGKTTKNQVVGFGKGRIIYLTLVNGRTTL